VPADRREVDQTLTHRTKLRYQREEGRNHVIYTLVLSGHQFGWTKVSRGSSYRTLDDTLLGKVARQVHLQLGQFKRAIECTINWPKYAQILRQRFPADAEKIPDS
jgi:hypothetical protein